MNIALNVAFLLGTYIVVGRTACLITMYNWPQVPAMWRYARPLYGIGAVLIAARFLPWG